MAVKKDAAFYRKQRLDDKKKAEGGDKKAKAELAAIEKKRMAARGTSSGKTSGGSGRSSKMGYGSQLMTADKTDYSKPAARATVKRNSGGKGNSDPKAPMSDMLGSLGKYADANSPKDAPYRNMFGGSSQAMSGKGSAKSKPKSYDYDVDGKSYSVTGDKGSAASRAKAVSAAKKKSS